MCPPPQLPTDETTSERDAPSLAPNAALVVEVDGLGRLRLAGPEGTSAAMAAVLEHVARRMLASAPAGARLVRLPGFRLGLEMTGTKVQAVALGDQLVAEARLANVFGLRFPLSVGVASYPEDGRTMEEVVASAGLAASRSSGRGGDVVLGFHVGMREGPTTRPRDEVETLLGGRDLPLVLETVTEPGNPTRAGCLVRLRTEARGGNGEALVFEEAARHGRLFELGQRVRAAGVAHASDARCR